MRDERTLEDLIQQCVESGWDYELASECEYVYRDGVLGPERRFAGHYAGIDGAELDEECEGRGDTPAEALVEAMRRANASWSRYQRLRAMFPREEAV